MEIKMKNIYYKNLKKVNINFKEGLINGIYGSNGSGKTNIAYLLGLNSVPSKGHIELDGITIDDNNPMINYNMLKFEVGFISQNPLLQMFCETVQDQMIFTLNQYGYKNNLKHIKDSLKMVSLSSDYLKRKINTLSSGEIFKLSLAITLSLNPKIVIMDEPFSFLDNKSQKELVKLLRILKNRYHKTIIILSHNMDLLYNVSDYLFILSDNHIVVEGTKQDIFKQHSKLSNHYIELPKLVKFVDLVKEKKNIKMGYRDNINDLLKDVYFYQQKF